jgi:predicted metal-dependent phosphotriesterase family hydrolase
VRLPEIVPVIETSWATRQSDRGGPPGATLVCDRVLEAPQGHGHWRLDRAAGLERATDVLRTLAELGIASVLDTTTIERGRDLELMREAGAATEVMVLPCTGLDAELTGVSSAFRQMMATELADFFISDLQRTAALTLAGTSAPGGFDERAALAVAFAHAETGAPVIIGAALPARVDQLLTRGIDPERIIAAGLDCPDGSFATVDAVAQRGVLLGFTGGGLSDAARAALIAYALRTYGPERVCIGTGEVAVRLGVGIDGTLVSVGDGDSAAALRRLADALASFGVPDAAMQRALRADIDGLLTGAPSA